MSGTLIPGNENRAVNGGICPSERSLQVVGNKRSRKVFSEEPKPLTPVVENVRPDPEFSGGFLAKVSALLSENVNEKKSRMTWLLRPPPSPTGTPQLRLTDKLSFQISQTTRSKLHTLQRIALTATLVSAAFAQRPPAFPVHPQADAATLERGKALYGVNCNFCHGSDARGGEGGPNLLRSELVLNDMKGELIAPVVLNGRGEMPALKLTEPQIADVAAYIHDFKVGGYDISRMTPPSVVVGDPKAGEAYFGKVCASCHSVTGDLKGIADKFANPKLLQNAYLSGSAGGGRGGRGGGGGGGGTPTTVTVTPTSGPKVEGRLIRIDDFIVTLMQADNTQRTFRRDGDVPKVEIHDPQQPHKNLLAKYTDTDIHNLTAFLVTVK